MLQLNEWTYPYFTQYFLQFWVYYLDANFVCIMSCWSTVMPQWRIQGGSLGSDEPPQAGSGCGGWKRSNWLCQSSSLRDIFTETTVYTTWYGNVNILKGNIRQAIIQLYFIYKTTLFPKKWTTQLMVITLSKPNRFSKFFHRRKEV